MHLGSSRRCYRRKRRGSLSNTVSCTPKLQGAAEQHVDGASDIFPASVWRCGRTVLFEPSTMSCISLVGSRYVLESEKQHVADECKDDSRWSPLWHHTEVAAAVIAAMAIKMAVICKSTASARMPNTNRS